MRNGKSVKDADIIKALIVHSNANNAVLRQEGQEWRGSGGLGVPNEASSKIRVKNGFDLCSTCRVGPIRAGFDGLSARRHMNCEGNNRAETQVGSGSDKAICVLYEDTR